MTDGYQDGYTHACNDCDSYIQPDQGRCPACGSTNIAAIVDTGRSQGKTIIIGRRQEGKTTRMFKAIDQYHPTGNPRRSDHLIWTLYDPLHRNFPYTQRVVDIVAQLHGEEMAQVLLDAAGGRR